MDRISKIILFKDDKVLLNLRDDNPNIDYPNTWSLIGGYIDKGESSEEAIKREVKEEINLKLNKVELISSRITTEEGGDTKFEENIFSAELPCDIQRLKLREGKKIQLFSLEELENIKIRPVFKKAILNFFNKKQKN